MARKSGLPKGTLDTLIEETRGDAAGASAIVDHDPLPVRTRARKAKNVLPPYTTHGSKRARPVATRPVATRPVVEWETDPVSRYAASRGLPLIAGPVPAIRLAVQFAMDVRHVAKKERTTVFGVLSRALAGYLNAHG